MSSTAINFQPGATAPQTSEPVEAAVREVSDRMAALNSEKRRLCSRLDELRSADPGLRRSRPRAFPVQLSPVTFYSIEEAGADEASAPLQVA